jgi:hypothetical protein
VADAQELLDPELVHLAAQHNPALEPGRVGFKNGQLLVKDPSDPDSTGKGDSTWTYCSYMWFWWSNTVGVPRMTYDGLTGAPIDILNKAFPNKDNYQSELQLLSKEANNFKERIWGNGVIRKEANMNTYATQDVNKATNNCKQLMSAVQYVSETRPRLPASNRPGSGWTLLT